jgi:hypothetical protein
MADVIKTNLAEALRAAVAALRFDANDPRDIPWLSNAKAALAAYDCPRSYAENRFIEAAHEAYGSDVIEIDDEGVVVSIGEEGGFVQGWLFVPNLAAGIKGSEGADDGDESIQS